MGCAYSRKDINDINPRLFRVYNVDDQGYELSPGKIEVTDTDLILYPKGKEAIRWPLRCLRRYGFDAELFSFESGRRCPVGPGIFAFRCKRAEGLFNLVQECIQRAGQEEHTHMSQSVTSRTNSRPPSVAESHDVNGFVYPTSNRGNLFGNGNLHLYVNGPAANDYMNTSQANGMITHGNGEIETSLIDFDPPGMTAGAVAERTEKINYAVLDLPKSTENLCGEDDSQACQPPTSPLKYADLDVDTLNAVRSKTSLEGLPICTTDLEVFVDDALCSAQANYINVGPEADASRICVLESAPVVVDLATADDTLLGVDRTNGAGEQHNYANLQLNAQPSPTLPRPRSREIGKINYIQLDLNRSSENVASASAAVCPSLSPTSPTSSTSLPPESPTKRTAERESYAMIDFHKTTALHMSNSGKGAVEEEAGSRKTRHSSTISELT